MVKLSDRGAFAAVYRIKNIFCRFKRRYNFAIDQNSRLERHMRPKIRWEIDLVCLPIRRDRRLPGLSRSRHPKLRESCWPWMFLACRFRCFICNVPGVTSLHKTSAIDCEFICLPKSPVRFCHSCVSFVMIPQKHEVPVVTHR